MDSKTELFQSGFTYRLKLDPENSHPELPIECKLVRYSGNFVVFQGVVVDQANSYEFEVENSGYYTLTGADIAEANTWVNVDKWVD